MLAALAALVLLLTGLDHWTTYLCLRSQLPGWHVSEANPLAAWLFASVGLIPGLLIDTAVTLGAVAFVLRTGLLSRRAKSACLAILLATTAFAAANNLSAVAALGISFAGIE